MFFFHRKIGDWIGLARALEGRIASRKYMRKVVRKWSKLEDLWSLGFFATHVGNVIGLSMGKVLGHIFQ